MPSRSEWPTWASSTPRSAWEDAEPVLKAIDEVLAPYGLVGGDHWMDLLKKGSQQPSEFLKQADEAFEEAENAVRAGDANAGEKLIEAAETLERTGGRLDAFLGFAPGWAKTGAAHLGTVKAVSAGASLLGLVSDANTLKNPADHGTMGRVDRVAAGVNAGVISADGVSSALAAADLATFEIPVVGQVALVGTGLYLAGDWAYHNIQPVHDFANPAASDVAGVAKGGWHAASSGVHSATHWIGSHL